MLLTSLCVGALLLPSAGMQTADFAEGLAIRGVVRSGRIPFPVDAVADLMANGTWKAPEAGETLSSPTGEKREWTVLKAGADGAISQQSFGSGYAYFEVRREKPEIALLEASGHGMVYVNGEPRAGDPYGYGWHKLPVKLKAGVNEFVFAAGRGQLKAKLTKPKGDYSFNLADPTLPDLRLGKPEQMLWGAVIVMNATERTAKGLRLSANLAGQKETVTELPPIAPLTFRKVKFRFDWDARLLADSIKLDLRLGGPGEMVEPYDSVAFDLRIRAPHETYKRTFPSYIDSSAQYYAVNPAMSEAKDGKAIVFSLHGASVEAIGQADAYAAKTWTDIVCPTNRRPFGFDWEDWGRLDALEALGQARSELRPDPTRIYLTGHSMGGHGTWSLGALHPNLWAAIGPSAGWRSFYDYGGKPRYANPTPVEAILQRADLASDTVAFARNLLPLGVYILHGDADDNVPVSEARAMRDLLKPIHSALGYHEQPGAGHWWENSDEPGAECVDWPAMLDMFAARRKPDASEVREIEFATPNPAIASRYAWAEIEQQVEPSKLSQIKLRWDPHSNRIVGTTVNVARLYIDLKALRARGGAAKIELDGQELAQMPSDAFGRLQRGPKGWEVMRVRYADIPRPFKSPVRNGPFKMAFDMQFVLVYGTTGTPEENAWAFAKARFDAETFAYRGNGAALVLSDAEYLDHQIPSSDGTGPISGEARNLILYGNVDTNRVWKLAVGDASTVRLERGKVTIGSENAGGDALACLAVAPKTSSRIRLVACIGGTGIRGMRTTDRLPYFVSGVHYPDWVVMTPDLYRAGNGGVLGCGFFGNDWKYSPENSAWNWRP